MAHNVAIHHVLTDGKSAASLFQSLLSTSPLVIDPSRATQLAPVQNTVSIKPPLSYLLPIVFRELLLPRLPKFIAGFFAETKPAWPLLADLQHKPSTVSDDFGLDVLIFENDQTIAGLKRAAARTGLRTINAVIHAAGLVALYVAITKSGIVDATEVALKTGTPTSARKPDTHGHLTGVHIGFVRNGLRPNAL